MTNDLKSTSTGPTHSGPNSVSSFADKLKAKTQAEADAIQRVTEQELTQLQLSLLDLSQAALATTSTAISSHVSTVKTKLLGSENEIKTALNDAATQINSQSESIVKTLTSTDKKVTSELGQTTTALSQQQKELREAMAQQTQQMVWLMKLPVAVLLAVCLAVCGATWVYWDLMTPYEPGSILMGDQKQYKIMKGDGWTTCQVSTDPGKQLVKACRPVGPSD